MRAAAAARRRRTAYRTSSRRVHGVPDPINNAGFAVYRTFEQSTSDEIEQLVKVNFAGHLLFTREVLDGMIDRRKGNTSSISRRWPGCSP